MTEEAPGRFWNWSRLALEEGPVREVLVALQDAYGINASLVLWCRWTEVERHSLCREDAIDIIEAVLAMDLYVVKRLREVRRYLATPRSGYPERAMQKLKRDIHAAEIGGEALIHARLEELTKAKAGHDKTGGLSGEALFELCRHTVDVPVITTDELGPASPRALFASVCRLLPKEGKDQKPCSQGTGSSGPGAAEDR